MQFGKRQDTTNTTDFCPRQLATDLLLSTAVVVPVTRRSAIGDRAFPVATARAWNSLGAYRRLSRHRRHCRLSNDILNFEHVLVCDLVLMALLTLLFLSLSAEHVVFFVCVMCSCSFWTKCHVNLFVNDDDNNNNNNNNNNLV